MYSFEAGLIWSKSTNISCRFITALLDNFIFFPPKFRDVEAEALDCRHRKAAETATLRPLFSLDAADAQSTLENNGSLFWKKK
jgi:hypothetical protein